MCCMYILRNKELYKVSMKKIKYWWSWWRYSSRETQKEKQSSRRLSLHNYKCLRARYQSFAFDRNCLTETVVFLKLAIMKASHQTLSVRSWSLTHPVTHPEASSIHLSPCVRGACFVRQPVKLDKWHYRVTITTNDEIVHVCSTALLQKQKTVLQKRNYNILEWLV